MGYHNFSETDNN